MCEVRKLENFSLLNSMVKLTQIDESTASEIKPQKDQFSEAASDAEYDSDSEFEDDFDENETIYERIVALKDIIPPKQRSQIWYAGQSVQNQIKWLSNKSGNLLWTLTSSALLLGVPLSLAILAETQLQEMENASLQQSAKDVLTNSEEKN